MEEIKYRYDINEKLLNKKLTTGQPMINIELLCLNFRNIFELIALSSICAHRSLCEEIFNKFEKEWNPSNFLKEITAIP